MTWPFDAGFSFRKAQPYDADKIAALNVETVGEQKLDGWRALVVVDPEHGDEHVFSRGVSKVTGKHIDLLADGEIPQLRPVLDVMPFGTALECELVWPGHEATDVPTALKNHRDSLQPVFYAAPYYGKTAYSNWRDERAILEMLLVEDAHLRYAQSLAFIQFYRDAGQAASPEYMEFYARNCGYEGFVVKTTDGADWWKWKGEATYDLVVLGATEAREGVTGKYLGQVGALIVGRVVKNEHAASHTLEMPSGSVIHVQEIAQISGMTDEERLEMTEAERSGDLVGRVVEVRAQLLGAKQRLRHPRFLRWREDKPAHECT